MCVIYTRKGLSLSQKAKTRMNKIIVALLLTSISLATNAQSLLKGTYYNAEYQIYLHLNADSCNVTVPGQEIYGELPGYFSTKRDSRLWLIIECERLKSNKIEATVINDYGSEDFTATLTEDDQGNITMKHLDGSTYKIVVNSKYVKIPKEIVLKKE